MKLIVGLGNPGFSYANNRHNVGFVCLSSFAKSHDISFDKKQGQARIGTGEIADNPVILARPQTYVNASGEAVNYLVNRYQVDLTDLIVIHDDLDLPLGKLRIKQGGGSGGHRGIESIIDWLESPDFVRVRIGIGRPLDIGENKETAIVNYVLNDFTDEEKQVMTPVVTRVGDALLYWITDGLDAAMNKFNQNSEAL